LGHDRADEEGGRSDRGQSVRASPTTNESGKAYLPGWALVLLHVVETTRQTGRSTMTEEKKVPKSDLGWQILRSVVLAVVLIVALCFASNWVLGWPDEPFIALDHSLPARLFVLLGFPN
jgi:hypothetical protein